MKLHEREQTARRKHAYQTGPRAFKKGANQAMRSSDGAKAIAKKARIASGVVMTDGLSCAVLCPRL